MPALDLLCLPEVAVLLTDHHEVVHWRLPGGLPASNNNLPLTEGEGVPPEPLLAGADGPVVVDLADGVLAAGSDAGVPAVVVKAGEAEGTLAVVLALSLPAGDERISLISRRTPALGCISCRDTLGVGTAGVGIAGIRLLPAASDGVWGGDVSRDALTDGVPLEVD